MLQTRTSLKAFFAPTAEAKKAGKASRRAEETPRHLLLPGELLIKTGYHPLYNSGRVEKT